jgi:hypothetical protein
LSTGLGNLPLHDGPITLGIDRGYVRDWEQKQCHFAVVSKRFCKRQQMQWIRKGAHLLLQTRVKTLNHELGAMFLRWYTDFHVQEEEA